MKTQGHSREKGEYENAAQGSSPDGARGMNPLDAFDFPAMRAQYRRDLFEDYLPFHDRFVVDHEFGGFMCWVRPSGERVSTDKKTWFEGRGIWVYSFLYNNVERDQKYLDIAERSLKLVQRTRPADPDQFWPKALTREGAPIGPPDTEIYSDMFIAEGLAEFARATGERRYWDEAREIVLKCERGYDRADYHPTVGQTYLGTSAKPFPGARVGGCWMVLLRIAGQMLALYPDTELSRISDRAVNALLNHHINPRFGLMNELINHDLSRPRDEYEQLVYAGHAVEILWMLMDDALRRRDLPLFERTAAMFRRHCEVSKDHVYGGMLRALTHVDDNIWTLDKTLYPQQEALIGSMLLMEQTGHSWAASFYAELDRYTRAHFPMRAIGSPLWQVAGSRQVEVDRDMARAENYHHPRFLMLNLLATERLLARNGLPVCPR